MNVKSNKRVFMAIFMGIFVIGIFTSTLSAGPFDALFNNKRIMDLLIDEAGRYIIRLIHPASRHLNTTLMEKSRRILKFKTIYKSWTRRHRLIWMIELSDRTIVSDFRFISDTSRFPSAKFANRLKNKIIQLIKYYYNKYIR